ncbi:sensory rhodopsin transducer [Stenotrophomonas maltophilia]|uniref:sensory rhodopsin transducer n=2 Tax=Stenotrophomonas maltophilia TaxID=40324 RepID=UPI001F52D1DE|nr:sensory rhodopsin transducer [Stenotrophomonas maltophilia]
METNASCIGHRRWAIAEGYIPAWSNGPSPEMQSHETCCVLNAGDEPAHVTLTLYFEDRDPVGPYRVTVPARRTCHLRFNDLQDPAPVPRGTGAGSCRSLKRR